MSITRRTTLAALAMLTTLPVFATPGKPLRLGVIGAGHLGGAVGRGWVKSGHEVMFASRHPENLQPWVQPLGNRASVGTPGQAAAFGDVILIAVPYGAIPQLGQEIAPLLKGKVVLDAANPYGSEPLAIEAKTQGAGPTTAKYFPGALLVRAFNAVDATAIEASDANSPATIGVPIAGDDATAVAIAAQLVVDAGCTPVVVGKLAEASRFQPGGPGFRANTSAQQLRQLLGLSPS